MLEIDPRMLTSRMVAGYAPQPFKAIAAEIRFAAQRADMAESRAAVERNWLKLP